MINGMIRIIFAGTWNDSEREYSIVLAQAGALSAQYRSLFLLEVAKLVDPAIGLQLKAAAERKAAAETKTFSGALGRTDLLLRSDDFLLVGIENQKRADLEGKRLLRYDEYLQLQCPHPLLVFLTPSTNKIVDEKAGNLDRFVFLNYEQLAGWADGCLLNWLRQTAIPLEQVLEKVTSFLGQAIPENAVPAPAHSFPWHTSNTRLADRNPHARDCVNPITLYGLFAVTAMLVCYAFERRSPWYILGFAVSCVLASSYGFLQGAWPFGFVEGVWAVVAMRR